MAATGAALFPFILVIDAAGSDIEGWGDLLTAASDKDGLAALGFAAAIGGGGGGDASFCTALLPPLAAAVAAAGAVSIDSIALITSLRIT